MGVMSDEQLRALESKFIHHAWDGEARIRDIARAKVPLLVLHGRLDRTTTLGHGQVLASLASQAWPGGKAGVVLEVFEDAGHEGIVKEESLPARVASFLQSHCG